MRVALPTNRAGHPRFFRPFALVSAKKIKREKKRKCRTRIHVFLSLPRAALEARVQGPTRMYVCIYVHFVCMYVCMYILYVSMSVCMYLHMYLYLCVCMYVLLYVCMCVGCMHCTYVCVGVCMCMGMYVVCMCVEMDVGVWGCMYCMCV
jgi:hypothetical protein